MPQVLLLILMLIGPLIPTAASAAYPNEATVLRYEQDPNGSARLILRFQGNAGEPIVDRVYPVTGTSTLAGLRVWIKLTVDELNLARAAGTAPQVAAGTVISGLTPTPSVPPAKSVWRTKVRSYRDACTESFLGALATACAALKTDIETTYQAGYLDVD